jgi:hypothetical protein
LAKRHGGLISRQYLSEDALRVFDLREDALRAFDLSEDALRAFIEVHRVPANF